MPIIFNLSPKILITFSFIFVNSIGFTQCPNDNNLITDLTPTGTGNTQGTPCIFGGEYATVQVTSGNTYLFSTCGSPNDTQLTLYSSTGVFIDYSDDAPTCSPASEITWVANFTGTVYVVFDEYPCSVNSNCNPLNVTLVSQGTPTNGCNSTGGETCPEIEALCLNSSFCFFSETTTITPNSGNNYGCLNITQNPSWFYLNISTAGLIEFELSANDDIDFALWGPFNNINDAQAQCGSLSAPLDCSYTISNTETATITNAQVGEVYILLITNYSSITQNVTASQTNGSGASDCSIVPNPGSCDADAGEW